jgi:hypothetical protein
VFEQMLGAGIRADPMAWTILITLWSKSSIPNKENKVQQIFKRYVQCTYGTLYDLSVVTLRRRHTFVSFSNGPNVYSVVIVTVVHLT